MERLPLKIDTDCFNIVDSRISAVSNGRMSLQAFAYTLTPDDPFVLIGDTIFALSEQEFYALRTTPQYRHLSETAFRYVLGLDDTSFMSPLDNRYLDWIRQQAPTCSVCAYRKYRDEVWKLVKKYNILSKLTSEVQPLEYKPKEYPQTTGPIHSELWNISKDMYKIPAHERKACLDCVEKHISQAYVLQLESYNGYPEYLYLIAGHLGEALAELPTGLDALKEKLEYCLARTNCTGRAFVPIHILRPLLQTARGALGGVTPEGRATDEDYGPTEHQLATVVVDITEDMKNELATLPDHLVHNLIDACNQVNEIIRGVENPDETKWRGWMACIGDMLAPLAPLTASMIRNRRIMFNGAPAAMVSSGYGLDDLRDALLTR